METMNWKRELPRLTWESIYRTVDEGDEFRIIRHKRSGRVQLWIWRGSRGDHSEHFDHLPSVREAKALSEQRRRHQGVAW